MTQFLKIISSVNYIVWLIISAIFFAFGEYFSKKFAISPKIDLVVLVVIIDALSTLMWLPAILQKNQLSVVGVMWSVLSLIATVSIGLLIFGEKINLKITAGIIFGIISIIFLSRG